MIEDQLEDDITLDQFVFVESHTEDSEKLAVEPYSYWKSVFRIFFKKKSAIVSIVLIAILLIMAILVPMILSRTHPYYFESNLLSSNPEGSLKNAPPSLKHIFGCDVLGRDLFAVLFQAVRVSFALALVVSIINAIVGIIIGMLWGYFKKLDPIMIEIYNFFGNIPSILLYLLLLSIMRQLNVNEWLSFVFVLTITGWLGMARFIRNQIIIINDREYNLASRTLGTPARRIILHNILPFILPVIITNLSLSIPGAISAETSLTFFGVGLKSTSIALGPLMTLGYSNWQAFYWQLLFPTLILGTITVSFYMLGMALSDALDPRTHR